jgi:hypothetical protein
MTSRSIDTDWLGNRVVLDELDETELTLVQWARPHHGAWRGARVLGRDELARLRDEVAALEPLRATVHDGAAPDPRTRYLRPDLAGTPLQLETLVDDLLGR